MPIGEKPKLIRISQVGTGDELFKFNIAPLVQSASDFSGLTNCAYVGISECGISAPPWDPVFFETSAGFYYFNREKTYHGYGLNWRVLNVL